jgi:hypothetical protein
MMKVVNRRLLMFSQKMQIRILLIILGVFVHGPAASAQQQELDSVGMMPEITVTATRYECEDEAWLGMVEGVVVEARRPSNSRSVPEAIDKSRTMISRSTAAEDIESSSMRLADPKYLIILLAFAALSLAYVAIRTFLKSREVKHDTAKH